MSDATHRCEDCRWRRLAVRKPRSVLARLWRWHTGWCPGWKRYQQDLERSRNQ